MKSLFTLLFVCFSLASFSQKGFYGRAVYHSKTSFDQEEFNKRDIPEDRKKRIMERIKSQLDKTFILNFNKTASIYEEEEKLETPGGRGGRGSRFGGFSGGIKYKNFSEKTVLEQKEFFGKKFLISEEATMPQWEMSAETRQIGQYLCYKATMLKNVDDLGMRPPFGRRGRGRDEKSEDKKEVEKEAAKKPKQIEITAWYTPQIPVSSGPDSFWGLPGLILEINADRTTILCTEVVLNPKEKIEIKAPKKGEKVTKEEYQEIVKKKMEEMREIWRGRRGGGRGSRR